MILIFEQDFREYDGTRFRWKPLLFRGSWNGKKTFRIGWGCWAITYCPEKGIKDFFKTIKDGNVEWIKM